VDGEESKRVERGNIPGQSSTESKEEGSRHFVRNGFEIFTFNSKTIVSWGLLSGLAGLIFATLAVYRSFGTQIDERITNHRGLNKQLDNHEFRINQLEKSDIENKTNIKNLENEVNPKGGKK